MLYRDWRAFQEAVAEYSRARARHDAEWERWHARLHAFDKDIALVAGWASLTLIGAGLLAYHFGASPVQWGWLCATVPVILLYHALDERYRRWQKARFAEQTPAPSFVAPEPTYEPRGAAHSPPPRQEAPPPRPSPPPGPGRLTLDECFRVLGIDRSSSLEQIRHAYRDRMREYHPDKVMHLGAELRELAERKAKQINAAYEALNLAYGDRKKR